LQFFLKLGAQVTKVHRAIRYKQAPIFREYIDMNTSKRAAATNEFEMDYFKLKNNSLYDKTVENLKKRMCLLLCTTEKGLVTYTSKANFKRTIKIADDFVAVLLQKEAVVLDRPSYIGQAVLDLSKLRMYQLQYRDLEKYRQQFGCTLSIIAGDTDSFFVECRDINLDILMRAMMENGLLDTSKFPKTHPLYSPNNTQIGNFKDESKGVIHYKEWIFLRPKGYSLLSSETETIKAKGISLKQTKISHESYRKVYEERLVISVPQKKFISRKHQIFTSNFNKVALSANDDKRKWVGANKSYAFGHYRIL
jgi:hypothetical protein